MKIIYLFSLLVVLNCLNLRNEKANNTNVLRRCNRTKINIIKLNKKFIIRKIN